MVEESNALEEEVETKHHEFQKPQIFEAYKLFLSRFKSECDHHQVECDRVRSLHLQMLYCVIWPTHSDGVKSLLPLSQNTCNSLYKEIYESEHLSPSVLNDIRKWKRT